MLGSGLAIAGGAAGEAGDVATGAGSIPEPRQSIPRQKSLTVAVIDSAWAGTEGRCGSDRDGAVLERRPLQFPWAKKSDTGKQSKEGKSLRLSSVTEDSRTGAVPRQL